MDNVGFAELLEKLYRLESLASSFFNVEEEEDYFLLSEAISNSAIPGLIGKKAIAKTVKVFFDGSNPIEFFVEASRPAKDFEAIISDSKGNIVSELKGEVEFSSKGKYKFVWHGLNINRVTLLKGTYGIKVFSKEKINNTIEQQVYIEGEISKMLFTKEGVFFKINNLDIAYDSLMEIRDF